MKNIIYITVFLLISNLIWAQNINLETVSIRTSIQCDMCKVRVGELLVFEKGVKSFDIDLETKYIEVVYNKKKTTADVLRQSIARVGYDADDVAANEEAYANLPACCKKPTDAEHVPHK